MPPAFAMSEDFGLIRDFAIIMAVAGGALVLFRRFNLPPILGYLPAGFIIGPFTLPNPPIENAETIRLLSDLGLVLLLFALGLEFGWERIRQVGFRVVLIGVMEMTFMIALGYEVGLLLGWSGKESFFLGAALSISSSAILVKMLRDSGQLLQTHGRLIVGILVVEDFAAVVLLSILSGVATTGTASASDVGILIGKLAVFTASALVLGGLLAPKLIGYVAKFKSRETLLITGLALCFGLALVAGELGLSAAAGAFIIGTVLGDSEHSEELLQVMGPVRDMFAALFFVSVGMLVDLSLFSDFIGPALIVSVVFVVGKVVADTMGAFVTGHDGRSSLKVGTGMPQIGEFSLAMVKVGADHRAISPSLYPIIAVTTAITSMVYPLIFRTSDRTAGMLERRSPRLLAYYVTQLSSWLVTLRRAFTFTGELTQVIRQSGRVVILNLGIIVVLITVGTFLLRFVEPLGELVHLQRSLLGLIIGFATIVLCVPAAAVLWKQLAVLADALTVYVFDDRFDSSAFWRRGDLRNIFRDSLLALILMMLAIWTIPLVTELLSIGRFSVPLPILLLVAVVLLTGRAAFKVHGLLEETFSRTFLGEREAGMSTREGNADSGRSISSGGASAPAARLRKGEQRLVHDPEAGPGHPRGGGVRPPEGGARHLRLDP